jgi:hypothetical protein
VEGVVIYAELGEKLKGGVNSSDRVLDAVGAIIPRAEEGLSAEGVRADASEGMPVAAC